MKLIIHLGAVILGSVLAATPSQAQFSNDEASATVLASHCAGSAGIPIDNYRDYGRGLALTLSLLTPQAQARVFEDKMPAVGSGGGTQSQTAPVEVSDQGGLLGGLLGIVGGVNEALFGDGSPVEPIIGGEEPGGMELSGYAAKAAEYKQKAEDLAKSDPEQAAYYAQKAAEYAKKAAEKAAEEAAEALEDAAKDASKAVEDAQYAAKKATEERKYLEDKAEEYQAKAEALALEDPVYAAKYAAKAAEYAAEAENWKAQETAAKVAVNVAKDAEKVAWDNAKDTEFVAEELAEAAEDAAKAAEKAAEDAAKAAAKAADDDGADG